MKMRSRSKGGEEEEAPKETQLEKEKNMKENGVQGRCSAIRKERRTTNKQTN
jgi:hypothetical protein